MPFPGRRRSHPGTPPDPFAKTPCSAAVLVSLRMTGKDPIVAFREQATVRAWVAGLREQWGEEPADMAQRIGTLERFCAFVEREPDAIIAECSREVEGGKRIRIKKRRFYSEKIEEFQQSLDGDAKAQTRAGNLVRSFLIHNGIFIQG